MAPICFGKTMPFSVAQKGTQSLPEDGIDLAKHVGAIVKEEEKIKKYIIQCIWLVNLYVVDNSRYKNKKQ
jgi:hypothetical protein